MLNLKCWISCSRLTAAAAGGKEHVCSWWHYSNKFSCLFFKYLTSTDTSVIPGLSPHLVSSHRHPKICLLWTVLNKPRLSGNQNTVELMVAGIAFSTGLPKHFLMLIRLWECVHCVAQFVRNMSIILHILYWKILVFYIHFTERKITHCDLSLFCVIGVARYLGWYS